MSGTDHAQLARMLRRYRDDLEVVHEQVVDVLTQHHLPPATRDLIFRHALLYFLGRGAVAPDLALDHRRAVGGILAYSLPLVSADIQLDRGRPALRAEEGYWVEYGSPGVPVLLTQLGVSVLAELTTARSAAAIVSQCAVSTTIAMLADRERARLPLVEQFRAWPVDKYLKDESSRLNGSRVAEVMFRLAAVDCSAQRKSIMTLLGRELGWFRQVADEMMDVDEDLGSNLLTLPVIYGADVELLQLMGGRTMSHGDGGGHSVARAVRQRLMGGTTADRLMGHVDPRLLAAKDLAIQSLPNGNPIAELMEQRRRQMDRAVQNGWREDATPVSVDELLESY